MCTALPNPGVLNRLLRLGRLQVRRPSTAEEGKAVPLKTRTLHALTLIHPPTRYHRLTERHPPLPVRGS
jgi:hypothetical protein